MGRALALFGEDDVLQRLLAAEELRDQGFTVIETGTAEEALAVVQSPVRLDVLIADIQLPGQMNGAVFAGRARKERPELKIIVASAYVPEWLAQDFVNVFQTNPTMSRGWFAEFESFWQRSAMMPESKRAEFFLRLAGTFFRPASCEGCRIVDPLCSSPPMRSHSL